MGISSLGAGSGILTQDILDQLKAADKAQFIDPLDSKISKQDKLSSAFKVIDAHVESVYQSLKSVTEYGVFEARTTSVGDDSIIEVSAIENSDIQDFSIEVLNLASKEIEQSGSFSSKDALIASASGSFELKVGTTDSETFSIDYDATTTLNDLKELINKEANGSVSATIVQIADDDFRLMLSSNETGTDHDITITDIADVNGIEHLNTALLSDVKTQSNSFSYKTDTVVAATQSGTLDLTVGTDTFSINYDDTTTLEELQNLINTEAGGTITASIIQADTGDYRLNLSGAEDIVLTDNGDGSLDTILTGNTVNSMSNIQTAQDASFKYNGLTITRSSNEVSDLLAGVTITLKDSGTSSVNIQQDRNHIAERITNFIDKYNSAMYQIGTDTKPSAEADENGIFSNNSTMRSMKSAFERVLLTAGQGVSLMRDYGVELDADGRLSLDTDKLNEKLNKNPDNVKSFFSGGTFTREGGSTIEMTGVFNEIKSEFKTYAYAGGTLDEEKNFMDRRTQAYQDEKTRAQKRLDDKYATMAKRFAAYDVIINKLNTASDMFSQMIETEIANKS